MDTENRTEVEVHVWNSEVGGWMILDSFETSGEAVLAIGRYLANDVVSMGYEDNYRIETTHYQHFGGNNA